MVYYNDNNKKACLWLGDLARADLITSGKIDNRSIKDVTGGDVSGYARAHFFAGIGGWDYALQLAGWPEDEPVWTGSCPCQPLSGAGKRKGEKDERHLWPEFYRLISECRPTTIFGEQVASKDGREWLDGVSLDLEELGYAVGSADLCAAGVGAPHIRQRLFWVAYGQGSGRGEEYQNSQRSIEGSGAKGGERSEHSGGSGGLGHTSGEGSRGNSRAIPREKTQSESQRINFRDFANQSFIAGADGKTRRIESRVSPLVDGFPGRVDLLRGFGNAIVPEIASEFIGAFMKAL